MKKLVLGIAVLIFSILPAMSLENLNFKYGYISDNAKVITQDDYAGITAIIKELQEKTTAEIAVVTVKSLQGQSIERTATEIGRKYKVGAADKNNGVVILVAPNERKARLEVGMGLESEITNPKADSIMNTDMVPYFAKGDYSKGIYRGVASTANLIAGAYGIELTNTANAPAKTAGAPSSSKKSNVPFWAWPIIIIAGLLGIGKKGNFGGGGGFSGGKGSTGSW